MRTVLLSTLALFAAVAAPAKEFKLYAQFTADTRVQLSDGAMWMMDKGDVFPVLAYKDMQKNVILQLGETTFKTETVRIRILKADEVAAGLEAYQKNVRAYQDSKRAKGQEAKSSPGRGDLFPQKP
jgi:hypothetical protein